MVHDKIKVKKRLIKILFGGIIMYIYHSEILKTSKKWFRKSANENDLKALDALINKRVSEGYEFVCYAFMTDSYTNRCPFVVTFRKEQ